MRLVRASFKPDIAVVWGLVRYRTQLSRTPPLDLAEEYEWLLQGDDCPIKDLRLAVVREEVEKRRIWDDWKEFVEWASTVECDNCGRKNRLRLERKTHRCGYCGSTM